jgi:hypothetical protein
VAQALVAVRQACRHESLAVDVVAAVFRPPAFDLAVEFVAASFSWAPLTLNSPLPLAPPACLPVGRRLAGKVSMHPLLQKLSGGTRRSIGRSNEVAAQVLAHPANFPHLMKGLAADDPVLRMRTADAIEKIATKRPDLLHPHKRKILAIAGSTNQQEIRWHAALIIPRLELTTKERAVALDILFDYLRDKSSIVRTFAMQAIWDLAAADPKLKSQITPLIEELTEVGTPAMRARGRKILQHQTHGSSHRA